MAKYLPYSRTLGNFIGVGIFLPTYFTSMKDQPKEKIGIPSINDPFWILTVPILLSCGRPSRYEGTMNHDYSYSYKIDAHCCAIMKL